MIFGDLMFTASEKRIYTPEDKTTDQEFMRRQLFYQHDQLHAFHGYIPEENADARVAYRLMQHHLTDADKAQCAQKAAELFEALEFSRIFYEKRHGSNPLEPFLHEMIAAAVRMDPALLTDHYHEVEVHEWFEGNEMIPSGLSVENPFEEGYYLLLTNCHESLHKDLIPPGIRVRFSRVQDSFDRDWHYKGRLIDIVKEAK